MACLFGARLRRLARVPVTLTGSWDAGLVTASRGVRIEDERGAYTVPLGALPLGHPAARADLVLVLTKSHRTAAVAPAVAAAVADGGHAVTLQNGLGNLELLQRCAGPARVSAGVATIGATLLGPGHVRATAGAITLARPPGESDAVALLADLFGRAGMETSVTENLDRLVWRKLAVNCAINPLSALLGVQNGQLLARPDSRKTLVDTAREVGTVAGAKGIDLGEDAGEMAVAVAEITAHNRSSMLQDVERGARTEVDAMNGAVVREAMPLGVPVPLNESLWLRLRELEQENGH
jgi:2-dehydropantoate 2-reductase